MCTKVCTVCHIEKDFDLFYNRKASEDGKAYRCKDCDNEAVTKFRKKHAVRYRNNARTAQLKYKYGLTNEGFRLLYEAQGGTCKICNRLLAKINPSKPTNETAVVDHCHKTNIVRGLLCTKCNRGLGHFKDDIGLLEKATEYLRTAAYDEIH